MELRRAQEVASEKWAGERRRGGFRLLFWCGAGQNAEFYDERGAADIQTER